MVLYSKLLEAGTFGKLDSFSKDNICEGIEWRDLVMIVEGIIESKEFPADQTRKPEKTSQVTDI